jgi:hypothetical protein
LPFRFVPAAGYATNLEGALEAAMLKGVADLEALPGKTGLLIDVSGSMDERIARKSETTRIDAAAGLAAASGNVPPARAAIAPTSSA